MTESNVVTAQYLHVVDGALERLRRSYDPISSRSTPYNQLFTTLIPDHQLPTEPLKTAQASPWRVMVTAKTVKYSALHRITTLHINVGYSNLQFGLSH